MTERPASSNLGAVVSIHGSVVEIRFDSQLPAIYSLPHAGEDDRIIIEVLMQIDAHHVRGIALIREYLNAKEHA